MDYPKLENLNSSNCTERSILKNYPEFWNYKIPGTFFLYINYLIYQDSSIHHNWGFSYLKYISYKIFDIGKIFNLISLI